MKASQFTDAQKAFGATSGRIGCIHILDRDLPVEYRPLDGLIPYARNARTHSQEQVAQIAASIREFGFTPQR